MSNSGAEARGTDATRRVLPSRTAAQRRLRCRHDLQNQEPYLVPGARTAEALAELERLLGLCEVQAVRSGAPFPLGARPRGDGVNFAIFSRHATGVRLDLFANPEDATPTRSIVLDAARNKTGDIWHVWLDGVQPGQLYGFRIAGPYAPHEGHRFNPNKLLRGPLRDGDRAHRPT